MVAQPSEPLSQRLTRSMRLTHAEQFKQVFERRCSVADGTLVVYARLNGLATSRLGLSVSRKVGHAVCRHQWKRRIREAFRRSYSMLPIGVDYVVIPRRGAAPEWGAIEPSVQTLFVQVVQRLRRQGTAR